MPAVLAPISRLWIFLGALNGLVSVAAGAYGRHGALEPAGREMFAIAAQYQMTHALALLAVAWIASMRAGQSLVAASNLAGFAFTLGILLFAGSLYWFGVAGLMPFAGSAPAGGWCLMAGWALLIWTVLRGAFTRQV